MKYGRQIPIEIVCCILRRMEKDIDIKLDLAGITNVPDNTHFSMKVQHQNILNDKRKP